MVQFTDIPGYGGAYQVGQDGSIMAVRGETPRTIRPHFSKLGRLRVTLYAKGNPRTHYVAKLVASAFLPSGGGSVVAHLNGNPSDCHYSNLGLTTMKQAMTQARAHKQWSQSDHARKHMSRPVASVDDAGDEVRYPSVTQAANESGTPPATLSRALKSGRQVHGLRWLYVRQ